MRRKLLAVASLFVLTLSACGSPSDEDVLTAEKIGASQSAPELPDVQLSENPEPPPAPPPETELPELNNAAEENVVETVLEGTVPPAFQGRWGMVAADCRPDDIGTGMIVTPDSISFADSIGHLTGVSGDYPRRFAGMFDYQGEERREEFVLAGGGNLLTRTSGGERFVYQRCLAPRPTG